MKAGFLQPVIDSPGFALAELLLILASGVVCLFVPELGMWLALLAVVPWILRLLANAPVFRRTPFDWLILVFLITAWVGYWAAYDKAAAWNKIWFIVLAILLYYSLSAQPGQNLVWVANILFAMGVGAALYYFLTYDFIASPRKLEFVNLFGGWLMGIRPETGWTSIHPNYVAGIVAVCVPFVLYPVLEYRRSKNSFPFLFVIWVAAGLLLAGAALIMTTSRGVVFAIFSGLGIWFLWKLTSLAAAGHVRKIFPIVLLAYLVGVVAFLYAGPAQATGAVTGPSPYGNGSRAELFLTAMYLTQDFPLTGGGLASFPGLFSQYMLNIPFYYLPNSHNLFLDVAIEQGLIGGAIFLGLYLASVWKVSSSIAMGRGLSEFQWILLFSLVIAMVHGMVDNYLYNGAGSLLSLFLIGLSVNKEIQPGDVQAGYAALPGSPAISSAIVFVAMVAALLLLRSTWYANLGAVRLAKIELAGFPANAWAEPSLLAEPGSVEAPLHSALRLDPANRTAHHRLGLIALSQGNFGPAAAHLEAAYQQSPKHRGIAKALGYSYAWLGEADQARPYLEKIPESRSELEAYAWWWQTQGRKDLSANASQLAASMKNETSEP